MRWISTWVLLAGIVSVDRTAGAAASCDFASNTWAGSGIDGGASAGVGTPPGPIGAVEVAILRGHGPGSEGCGSGSSGTGCDGLGQISLSFAAAEDPDSATSEVGYRLNVIAGTAPAGAQGPGEILIYSGEAAVGGAWFYWIDGATDDQESFDFTVTLTPVDKDGNVGPTSAPIRIVDSGSGGGCGIRPNARVPSGVILVALALMGLRLGTRRRRA